MSPPVASPTSSVNVSVLAAKRTLRPDPLNSFQMYDGGWNLGNISYLASAGFTGLPGFVIALMWFVIGCIFVIVLVCIYCCCKEHLKYEHDYGKPGYYIALTLLLLFTLVTIGGCGALFAGQEAFHLELSAALDYLMTQATEAVNTSVQSVPPAAAPQASQTATAMATATNSTSAAFHAILDEIRLALIGVSTIMLGLSLFGLLFVAFGLRPVVYTMVGIGWLFIIGTWTLFGVFLLIYTIFGDTCVAMQEWVANPRGGNGFDIIMPCSGGSQSSSHYKSTRLPPFNEEGYVTEDFNRGVYVNESKSPTGDRTLSYDQWLQQPFVQQKSSATPPPPAASNDSCQTMRTLFLPIFKAIETQHCPNLLEYTMWVWIGLATLSSGSMFSIILWTLFIRRANMRFRKVGRNGTKNFEVNAKDPRGFNKKKDIVQAHVVKSSIDSSEGFGAAVPIRTRPPTPQEPMEVTMTINLGGRRRNKRNEDEES